MLGILADGAARRLYQWAHNNAAATFPPEMQRRFTIHRPSKFLWRFELRRCRECLGPAKQDGSGVVLDMSSFHPLASPTISVIGPICYVVHSAHPQTRKPQSEFQALRGGTMRPYKTAAIFA